MPKHFLSLADIQASELRVILDEAHRIKTARKDLPKGHLDPDAPFKGETLALIFEKSSTRTRFSFDMAMRQLGGSSITATSNDMQIGRGETIEGPVFAEHIDGGTEAPRVCVREGNYKLVLSRAYPPQLYDLASDPLELNNLAGENHPEEVRLSQLAESTWPLDTLLDDVIRSQSERKLVDAALSVGRQEQWDFIPQSQGSNYVRRGDAFPTVERRGYLPYSD